MSTTDDNQLTERKCSDCGEIKPITDYVKDPSKSGGRGYRCKPCRKIRNANRREQNREYQAANRGRRREWKKARRKTQVGLDEHWAENAKRRARAAGAPVVELVKRQEVFERDGWICQLCGLPTLRETGHHPMSASVDHIIPLAEGGDHTYDNCVTAHLACNNWEKRNKSLGDHWADMWEKATAPNGSIPFGTAVIFAIFDPATDINPDTLERTA